MLIHYTHSVSFCVVLPVLDKGFEHKMFVNVHLALLDDSNLLSNTLAMTLRYWIDASFCSDIETGLNLGIGPTN